MKGFSERLMVSLICFWFSVVCDLFTWTNLVTSELVPFQLHVPYAYFIKRRFD